MSELLIIRRLFIEGDPRARMEWMTLTTKVLEESLPLPTLLKFLGEKNYLYAIQVDGFREGDEDGDQSYIGNVLGNPDRSFKEANGILNRYATDTEIMAVEVNKSLGGF